MYGYFLATLPGEMEDDLTDEHNCCTMLSQNDKGNIMSTTTETTKIEGLAEVKKGLPIIGALTRGIMKVCTAYMNAAEHAYGPAHNMVAEGDKKTASKVALVTTGSIFGF